MSCHAPPRFADKCLCKVNGKLKASGSAAGQEGLDQSAQANFQLTSLFCACTLSLAVPRTWRILPTDEEVLLQRWWGMNAAAFWLSRNDHNWVGVHCLQFQFQLPCCKQPLVC